MKWPLILIMIISTFGYSLSIYGGFSHQINPWFMWVTCIIFVLMFVYAGFELTRPQY